MVEPREGPLHHPSPGRMRLLTLFIEFLFPDAANVRHVAENQRRRPAALAVKGLVEAQVLLVLVRVRRLDHHLLQNILQEQRVVPPGLRPRLPVGRGHEDRQWPTLGIGQQAAFAAAFGAVRRVGTDAVPPLRALPKQQSAL